MDDMGLWEHQGRRLTVADLRAALSGLDDGLAIEIGLVDGAGVVDELLPSHIDLRGEAGAATAVYVTVTRHGDS